MLVLEDPGGETLDGFPFRADGDGAVLALRHRSGNGARRVAQKGADSQGCEARQRFGLIPRRVRSGSWVSGLLRAFRASAKRPHLPSLIAGTLPYMAPEQTGRMN